MRAVPLRHRALGAGACVLLAAAQTLPVFPNVRYAAVGYDIAKGNPLSDGSLSGGVDPGFRLSQIFELTYNMNENYENKWAIPDNFSATRASSCAYTAGFAASAVSTFTQYQSLVSAGGSFGLSFLPVFSFSASGSAHQLFAANGTEANVLLTYTALCTSYSVGVPNFADMPALTDNFKAGVAALPSNVFDPSGRAALFAFATEFGTHYPTAMTMGGNSHSYMQLSGESYTQLLSAGVDLSAAAYINFFLSVNGSVGAGLNVSDYNAAAAAAIAMGSFGIPTIATPCPAGNCNDVSAWQAEVDVNPYPMQFTLAPLDALLTPALFPNDPAIAAKAMVLQSYYAGMWCEDIGVLCFNANPLQGLGSWFAPSAESCPVGWAEMPNVAGRMVLSVDDPAAAGVSLGAGLPDATEPTHCHDASAEFGFAQYCYCGLEGSNHDLAHSGDQPSVEGPVAASTSGYPYAQLRFCVYTAPNDVSGLSLPFGAAAYVLPDTQSSCPAGMGSYPAANGRFIVPMANGMAAQASVNAPLSPGTDVVHGHDGTIVVVDTAPVKADLIGGCGLCTPASGGPYAAPLDVTPTGFNLSYVSMLTCVSQTQSFNASAPSGMVLLWSLGGACPAGWLQLPVELSGRLPIATQPYGVPGRILGSETVITGANYTTAHSHDYSFTLGLSIAGIEAVTDKGGGPCAQSNDYAFSGTTEISGAASSTLPYITIMACVSP